ncbi:MAG: hypothetical protein K8W52_19105 [Deltaproteobacteria bacterium]|nr:hypothetical protein [Deltaproteobacteria bacterium]
MATVPHLRDLIADADATDDVARRRAGIEAALAAIRAAMATDDDLELRYLLGYATYLHPDRRTSPALQAQLAAALDGVLAIAPAHAMARSYLGHDAYDRGAYADAEALFLGIDPGALSPYLALKHAEMIACCALRLRPPGACVLELEALAEACAHHEWQDIHPLNLYHLVREVAAARGAAVFDPVRDWLAQIDEAAEGDWFASALEPG